MYPVKSVTYAPGSFTHACGPAKVVGVPQLIEVRHTRSRVEDAVKQRGQ